MVNAHCSPMSPPSGVAADAVDSCSAIDPSPADSADVASSASGTTWPERLSDLHSRCEGTEAEWWQALVVGYAVELTDFAQPLFDHARSDGPESIWPFAMSALDTRVRWVAGVEVWPAHEDLAQRALRREALDAAEAAVLDELLLFHRRRGATDFSTENQSTESGGTMATKTTTRKPKPAKPVTETDEQLVLRALSYHGWQRWQQCGISDDVLLIQIRERLSQALVHGPRVYAVDHTIPAMWFDQSTTSGVPDLADDELVATVRRLFSLPFPAAGNEASPVEQLAERLGMGSAAAGPRPVAIVETIDVPLVKIVRSPFQTRDEPSAAWLDEVVESLRAHGQTTPALGRWVDDAFELIAGHTRWAAASLLEWDTLRCEVCVCDDATAARLVYIENADRRELTVIERARGLKLLADQYAAAGRTQAEAAKDASIAESTMSNMLRMLRLPAEWQTRVSDGDLSIEQSRTLATWSDCPAVLDAVTGLMKEMGVAEGPVDKHHFERALERATERGSRPMSKDSYGRGCLFTPTEAERKELDIREVKSQWGPPSKRAFNVTLWNKLNNAAKKRIKEREAKQAEKAGIEPPKPTGQQRNEYQFRDRLETAWQRAFRKAFVERVTGKQKLSKTERAIVARMGLMLDLETEPQELLAMSAQALDDWLFGNVQKELTRKLRGHWDQGEFRLPELQAIAAVMHLDPAPHFQIEKETLDGFGDADLATLAKQLDIVLSGNREQRIKQLTAITWPREEVPAILQLAKPKKGKKR